MRVVGILAVASLAGCSVFEPSDVEISTSARTRAEVERKLPKGYSHAVLCVVGGLAGSSLTAQKAERYFLPNGCRMEVTYVPASRRMLEKVVLEGKPWPREGSDLVVGVWVPRKCRDMVPIENEAHRKRMDIPLSEHKEKPGFVISPYAVNAGYVDVRKAKGGSLVKCPYTGMLFVVPTSKAGVGVVPKPQSGK